MRQETGAIRIKTLLTIATLGLSLLMLSPGFRQDMLATASPIVSSAIDKLIETMVGRVMDAMGSEIEASTGVNIDSVDLSAVLDASQNVDPSMVATALAAAVSVEMANPGSDPAAATLVARAQSADPNSVATAMAAAQVVAEAATGGGAQGEEPSSTTGSLLAKLPDIRTWLTGDSDTEAVAQPSAQLTRSAGSGAASAPANDGASGGDAAPATVDLADIIAEEVVKGLPEGMSAEMTAKVSGLAAQRIVQELAGQLPAEMASKAAAGMPVMLTAEEARELAQSIPTTSVSPATARVLQRLLQGNDDEAPAYAAPEQSQAALTGSGSAATPTAPAAMPSTAPRATATPGVTPVSEAVIPTLMGVADNGDGTFAAEFAYVNPNSFAIGVPVGPDNYFVPDPIYRGQPSTFKPGDSSQRSGGSFTVVFSDDTCVWHLMGVTVSAVAID